MNSLPAGSPGRSFLRSLGVAAVFLAALTASFCAQVGYRGVFDLDWRRDLRTGQYHLLDFNPRVGASFRLFEDDAGIFGALATDVLGSPLDKLVVLAIITAALSSTQTTILPASRTTLSISTYAPARCTPSSARTAPASRR